MPCPWLCPWPCPWARPWPRPWARPTPDSWPRHRTWHRPCLGPCSRHLLHILGIAAGPEVVPPLDSPPAPPLDLAALQGSARALNGTLTTVTVDDTDVRRLNSRVQTSFAKAPPADGERWRDQGWWLLFPLALLVLLNFRGGGAVAAE